MRDMIVNRIACKPDWSKMQHPTSLFDRRPFAKAKPEGIARRQKTLQHKTIDAVSQMVDRGMARGDARAPRRGADSLAPGESALLFISGQAGGVDHFGRTLWCGNQPRL